MRAPSEGNSTIQERVQQLQAQSLATVRGTQLANKAEEAEGSLVKTDALESMANVFKAWFSQYGDLVTLEVTPRGLNIAISAPAITKALSKAISEEVAKGAAKLTLPTLKFTELNVIGCFNVAKLLGIEVPPDLQRLKEFAFDPKFAEQLKQAGAKALEADAAMAQAMTIEEQAREMMTEANKRAAEAEAVMAEAKAQEEQSRIRLAEAERLLRVAEEMKAGVETKLKHAESMMAQALAKEKQADEAMAQARTIEDQAKAVLLQGKSMMAQVQITAEESKQRLALADRQIEQAEATKAEVDIKTREAEELNAQIRLRENQADEKQAQAEIKTQEAQAVRAEAESTVAKLKEKLAQAETKATELEEKMRQVTTQQAELPHSGVRQKQAQVVVVVDMKKVENAAGKFFAIHGDNLRAHQGLFPQMEWEFKKDYSFIIEMLILAYFKNYHICSDRYFFSSAFGYCKQHGTLEQLQRLLKAFINNNTAFRESGWSYDFDIISYLEGKEGVIRETRGKLIEAILSDPQVLENLFAFGGSNPHPLVWNTFLHMVEETKGDSRLLDYLTGPNSHCTFKEITPGTLGVLLTKFGVQHRSKILGYYLECFKSEYLCKRTLCRSHDNLLEFLDQFVLIGERLHLLKFLDDYPFAFDRYSGVLLLASDKETFTRRSLAAVNSDQNTLQPITDNATLDGAEKQLAEWFDLALKRNTVAYEKAVPYDMRHHPRSFGV